MLLVDGELDAEALDAEKHTSSPGVLTVDNRPLASPLPLSGLLGLPPFQARRSRNAAAFTRFWQAVEQKRLLSLRVVST